MNGPGAAGGGVTRMQAERFYGVESVAGCRARVAWDRKTGSTDMKSVKHRTNVVVANSAGAAMGGRPPRRKEPEPAGKQGAKAPRDNGKGWISDRPHPR